MVTPRPLDLDVGYIELTNYLGVCIPYQSICKPSHIRTIVEEVKCL